MQDFNFGKRFSELMEIKKISNTELTEIANISKNNVGNYKNGQIPNATILYKLSQILGTTMEYLLTGKDSTELSEQETELLEKWRKTNDKGRESIMSVADAMALTQPRHEPLSTSQTG